jgi:hypothetical protein
VNGEMSSGPIAGAIDSQPADGVGRRGFIAGALAGVFGAMAGGLVGDRIGGLPPVGASGPLASFFEPLPPRRLCDTRERVGYQRLDDNTIRVKVAGNGAIAADAVAAVLTVTAVNRRHGPIFVTAYPAGQNRPNASSLNCGFFDERVANLVTVKLGQGAGVAGHVDIYAHGPADVVVDVAGVYRPTSVAVGTGRLITIAPVRRVDTRLVGAKPAAGSVVRCNLNGLVSASAVAVVANVTAVEPVAQGFVTAYPRGEPRPETSNMNPAAGQNRAVGIMTKLGRSDGVAGIDVFTLRSAHIIVDVMGYITGPDDPVSSTGLFVPMVPQRLLDTRPAKSRLWPGWTRTVPIPAPIDTAAQAVAANLTVTQTMRRGFFTAFPTQTARGDVSTSNVMGPDQTVANHSIARISPKGMSVYSHQGGHVVVDLNGWFIGAPTPVTTAPPVNPPPPPGPLPWMVNVARMGLSGGVFAGAADPIVDSGHSWHWTGTGLVGHGSKVVVFGHRTEAGGPYRYQHELRAGDLLYVHTADRRRYTYRMAAEYITGKYPSQILDAARRTAGATFTLVSCSRANRLPTSLEYRIVSTFQLVEWTDLG